MSPRASFTAGVGAGSRAIRAERLAGGLHPPARPLPAPTQCRGDPGAWCNPPGCWRCCRPLRPGHLTPGPFWERRPELGLPAGTHRQARPHTAAFGTAWIAADAGRAAPSRPPPPSFPPRRRRQPHAQPHPSREVPGEAPPPPPPAAAGGGSRQQSPQPGPLNRKVTLRPRAARDSWAGPRSPTRRVARAS